MGKIPTFNPAQEIILDEIRQSDFLRSQFYFTGGTALSFVYLHHRYSEDLDFFSEHEFGNSEINLIMEKWSQKHKFSFEHRANEVVSIFDLKFPEKSKLKVDFGYYPYKQLSKGIILDGISVDSQKDIAANKIVTVSQRSDVKDFVDLYFILQKLTISELMHWAALKFHREIEPLILASDFLKIDSFNYLPKMIKPLSLDKLKKFFHQQAVKLGAKTTF